MNGEIFDWIANQGFAIAVAGFLLLRLESKMDKLITVIEDLCKTLEK